jgi:hypothetical protein
MIICFDGIINLCLAALYLTRRGIRHQPPQHFKKRKGRNKTFTDYIPPRVLRFDNALPSQVIMNGRAE